MCPFLLCFVFMASPGLTRMVTGRKMVRHVATGQKPFDPNAPALAFLLTFSLTSAPAASQVGN